METSTPWTKAKRSGSGGCVEVRYIRTEHGWIVEVRNSRFQERVVKMRLAEWRALVIQVQQKRRVDLQTWFPRERYADFADTFSEYEHRCFEDGVLQDELPLTGSHLTVAA